MNQALYRKWRPHRWEEVIGQEHIVQTLRNAVAAERLMHAYLFAGPRGTGKTTTARLLAKAANCLEADPALRPCDLCAHCLAVNQGRFLDLIEIDAASNTSVDDVRDLREKINFSPNLGRYKVYIVDEVHMLSTAAFNALLKTLEEPPAHAIFILATTEVHKIPATVLSRCQRHEFRRIPVKEITENLARLVKEEGLQADDEALTFLARQATGSMRDAISLLDQLSSSGKPVTLELAQTMLGAATSQAVLEIVTALIEQTASLGLDSLHRTLDAGSDPRQFARQIVDYLRNLLLVRAGNAAQVDATSEIRTQMESHAGVFTTPDLLNLIQIFNRAANEARLSWQPSLPLEMAFIQALSLLESPETPHVPPFGAGKSPTGHKSSGPAQPPAPNATSISAETHPTEGGLALETPVDPLPTEKASGEDAVLEKLLDEHWARILAMVRQQSIGAYGALNSCKSRFLRHGILTLVFANEIIKSKIEKDNNIALVEGVLQQVTDRRMIIRCLTSTGKQQIPPPEVDHDGMVAAALRDLGGEIVDVQ